MARTKNANARPAGKRVRADGRVKCQMYLPARLVKQLKHLVVDEDKDLGELAAPVLRGLVGDRYQSHRRPEGEAAGGPAVRIAPPPDPATDVGGEGDEAAA